MFPVSYSAPRDDCAFMILSVSSTSVGMKRIAIEIVMAIIIIVVGAVLMLSFGKKKVG